MLSTSCQSQREYGRTVSRMGWSMLLFIGLFYALNIPSELFSLYVSNLTDSATASVLTVVSGVLSTLAYMAPFIGTGLFYLFLSRKTVTQRMRLEVTMPPRFPLLILTGLAVITVGAYVNAAFCELIGYTTPDDPTVLPDYSGPVNVINYMTTAIAPAFAEELLFRGVYYTNLRPYGRTQAVLISALLFALMHQNPAQIIYTFMAGMVMAMMYELTGSIWCSILFHLLNNEMAVLSEILIYGKFGENASMGFFLLDIVTVVLGIAALILLYVFGFEKKKDPREKRIQRGHKRRLLTQKREVPPVQGETTIRDRAAGPLSSLRALLTPGMMTFSITVVTLMMLSWLSYLIQNAT